MLERELCFKFSKSIALVSTLEVIAYRPSWLSGLSREKLPVMCSTVFVGVSKYSFVVVVHCSRKWFA